MATNAAIAAEPSERAPQWRRLLAIGLLAGAGLRVVLLLYTAGMDARVVDEQQYLVLAGNLADGHGFASTGGLTSLRPPLYPAFVATLWRISGSRSLRLVRVAQMALALATALLVYRLGTDVFSEKAGVVAALIVWWYPSLVFASYLILTEVLFTFLLVSFMSLWARLARTGNPALGFASGGLVGLAALTRSIVWPFAILLAPFTFVVLAGARRRRATAALLLVGGWGLTLAPWAIRNTRLWGMPVVVDTIGGMNLRMGNYEFTPHERIWDAVSVGGAHSWIVGLPAAPPGGGPWTEAQKERWARGKGLEFMAAHPTLTAWRSVIKFCDFWALERDFAAGIGRGLYSPPTWFGVVVVALTLVCYPVVLALAIVGAVTAPSRDWRVPLLALVLIAFVCVLHAIVFGHPRYRLPLTPLFALFAGAALADRGWRQLTAAPRKLALVTALWTACAAIWAIQFAWRDWSFVAGALGRWSSGTS